MKYRAAQGIELVERDGATFLMAKTPLTLVRLNGALVTLVRRAMEDAIAAATEAEARVLEQLALKGFLVRETGRAAPAQDQDLPTVSVVIPVLDRAGELARCLESIRNVDYPKEKLQLIVVDDGSRDESAAVARGLGAIVLVPEIALTPQTLGRFRLRFGDRVAVLHSGLSDAERRDERERIASGEAPDCPCVNPVPWLV